MFDDLSDNPEDWQIAQYHETATKPHGYQSTRPIIERPFEEAEWFNAIGFPFTNWMESRFCDGSFGIWYGSDTVKTSAHETIHHWQKGILADAGFDELVKQGQRENIKGERKVYWVQCDAALADTRQLVANYPDLINPDNYVFTQGIGTRLHREGHPGLVARSSRRFGDNFSVLNKNVLSNPQFCCYLTYSLSANGIDVERDTESVWLHIPLV